VRAVNDLLGIRVSRRAVKAVARKAEAIRSGKPTDRDHDHTRDHDHDHAGDRDGRDAENAAASDGEDAGKL